MRHSLDRFFERYFRLRYWFTLTLIFPNLTVTKPLYVNGDLTPTCYLEPTGKANTKTFSPEKSIPEVKFT